MKWYMWNDKSISLDLQGRSACGVTRSLRTAATRWWSSLSEPSCTPRTANSSTSSAPESQVKYRSYIHMQPDVIKNECECLRRGGMHLAVYVSAFGLWMIYDCENASTVHSWFKVNILLYKHGRFRVTCSCHLSEFGCWGLQVLYLSSTCSYAYLFF